MQDVIEEQFENQMEETTPTNVAFWKCLRQVDFQTTNKQN